MKRRTHCPVAFSLDLFGDRWTLRVVRDLAFKNKHSFSELQASDDGIATNILTDRLQKLEKAGLVLKERAPNDGRRYHYRLSEAGKDLIPVLIELIVFSAKHDPETDAPEAFVKEAIEHRDRLVERLRKDLD